MVQIGSVQKTYAMVIGVVLLLVGVIGLFTQTIIWFGVNILQSILHIIGGALGVWLASKNKPKGYNMWLGYIAAVVAIFGFVVPSFMATLLNINMATTYLHVIIAVASLIVAFGTKE